MIGSLRRLAVPFSDLEDVLHEVFVVMLTRWPEYDQARPIRPWLFGIAFRVAASHRRKSLRELPTDTYAGLRDQRALPDDAAAANESRALLLSALAQIPLQRRAVLILHDVDGTPMSEVARELAIPLFTAYSRLRKARQELDLALTRLEKGNTRVD